MSFEQDFDVYLRARFTLMVLVSPEEERVLQTIKCACDRMGRPCLMWDVAEGFHLLTGSCSVPSAADPKSALEQVDKLDGDVLVILKDFHECWDNAVIKRKLRSVAQKLKFTRKSILITAPSAKIPPELKDETVIIDFPLPNVAELSAVLDRLTQTPGLKLQLTALGREKLLQAAIGLSASQAQRTLAKAIVRDGKLDDTDIELVTQEKKQIIRESEALEFYSITETLDDVGGLGVLKEWLRLRERAFTQEARDYGLPAPKGIALIGIPGTGKSLTAKMIGGLWRLPLLRLDAGSLFGSLVGESEERTRRALRIAETVAPCIVWIDEIEKTLACGGNDSGTSTRVFGTVLTWMQEKTAPCFVVATANDIQAIPPELLRKGRFDEVFFLDLPTLEERQEIFTVHLRKRNRIPQDFDCQRCAKASEGYVGAEIEQSIIEAMYLAFNEHREFNTDDILLALSRQVPLSVSQSESITMLRDWLKEGRAQSASFEAASDAVEKFVPIKIELHDGGLS